MAERKEEEGGSRTIHMYISFDSIGSLLLVRSFPTVLSGLTDLRTTMGLLIKQGSPSYALPQILRVGGRPLTYRDTGRSSCANRAESELLRVGRSLLYGHLPSCLSECTENCRKS